MFALLTIDFFPVLLRHFNLQTRSIIIGGEKSAVVAISSSSTNCQLIRRRKALMALDSKQVDLHGKKSLSVAEAVNALTALSKQQPDGHGNNIKLGMMVKGGMTASSTRGLNLA
jgi:hypothetical protein